MSKPAYVYGTVVEHGALELDVEFGFDVAWGSPETGRNGPPEDYDPGSGSVVEGVVILEVEGQPWPCSVGEHDAAELGPALLKWAADHDDDLLASAEETAAERQSAGEEYIAEARREDARLEQWPWLRDDDLDDR